MTPRILLALAALAFAPPAGRAETITVPAARIVIVTPSLTNAVTQAAAEELGRHLRLITGREVPVVSQGSEAPDQYAFRVGIPAPGDDRPLKPEEARWRVDAHGSCFYGDDDRNRGTVFAVYAFLEEQLGVRWLAPGEKWFAFEKQDPLKLTAGRFSWAPELTMRKIRTSWRAGKLLGKNTQEEYDRKVKATVGDLEGFARTAEAHDALAADVAAWQARMRMGGHDTPLYGHAFTGWWDRYGKEHPDYFALNRWGKREPEMREDPKGAAPALTPKDRESVKLCPSNPAVAEQIVQDWVKAGGSRRSRWINVCENDQIWGFCRCPACLALDGRKGGPATETYLTDLADRYVHLANAVAREARKVDPGAGVVMYAYEAFEQPPRHEKLEPGIVVAIVPTTLDLPSLEKLYGGWKAAGASAFLVRPNYHTYYHVLAIPTGFEKQMFDAFQAARKHGVIGADYDSLIGHWAVTGLADYALAHALSQPEAPFEQWEDQFCAAYGPAAADVKKYFRHWREGMWDKRLGPNLGRIVEKARYHNFARGLLLSMGDYYQEEDFTRADAILKEALKRKLSAAQKEKVEQLVLANQHARLVYDAAVSKGGAKAEAAGRLVEFRKSHLGKLDVNFLVSFWLEGRSGNATGVREATRNP